MPAYCAFGRTIRSSCALPPLEAARDPAAPSPIDLTIEVLGPDGVSSGRPDAPLWYERHVPDEAGSALEVMHSEDGDFRFVYADGCEFVVNAAGNHITAAWPAELSLEDACEYLLGPAVAFALRLQGEVCLHASAIAVDEHCFAVLAPAGHGKSTTAGMCARLGMAVLTDDVLLLRWHEDDCVVVPAYPRVRLWPEAAEALFGTAGSLPRITPHHPGWDKRFLDLTGPEYRYQRAPLPLATVFTHERESATVAGLTPIPQADALVTLLSNVYSLSRPSAEQRGREFSLLDRVARTVPVQRFRGPFGLEHVEANCRALIEACRSASATAVAED